MWCMHLVTSLNRAILTLVSSVTRHISLDSNMRNDVLRYNLVEGGVGRVPDDDDDRVVTLDKTGYWSDILKKQFSVHKGNVTCDHYTNVRITPDDGQQRILVLDSIMMPESWIYGCLQTEVVKNTRVCTEAQMMTSKSDHLPGYHGERKVAILEMQELDDKGYSHIVLHTPADSHPSQVRQFTPNLL